MTEIIHVIPDTPMSVLELFQPTKEGVELFASKIATDVHEGRIDPLRVKLLCKTMEKIYEAVDEKIKDNQKTEAAKYGEKPFMFHGAEFHYTATKTEYDYKACEDPELNDLSKELAEVQAKIKRRQEWLKTMGGPETVVIKGTGEITTIYPPIKKSVMGVKVTFK